MLDEKKMHYDDDEIVRSQEGTGLPFAQIVENRITRRGLIHTGVAAAVSASFLGKLAMPAAAIPATPSLSPTGLDFTPIPPSTDPGLVFSPNYTHHTVLSWGDRLTDKITQPDPAKITPDQQAQTFGYNNDFVGYLPLPYGSDNSRRGLLGVNHEYVNPELMFPVQDPAKLTNEQTEVCIQALGFTVVEVRLERGQWKPVLQSRYNKRHTGDSPILVTGPAAGNRRMKTSTHREGTTASGTFANCAAGKTPWGTVLSGEENFQSMFGNAQTYTDPTDQRSAKRYGIGEKTSEYNWEAHFDRFDCAKEPNEPNHFGWIVEIDPYDPDWTPRKRTALGRFRHEAATTHVTAGGKVVMYSGDDARFEYVYKFVSRDAFDPEDREKNRDLMDHGTLFVAKFNEDGTGEWLPLVFGHGPLTQANGFSSQADVVIDVRIAADLLGATKMDRPEDIEVNPVNEKVYIVCTNNTDRGKAGKDAPDAMNPRPENKHGHIIELVENQNDHASTLFTWELFLVCGDPEDEATFYAGFPKDKVSPVSCPDNICFDNAGNLWIATDGQERSLNLRDGFFAVPTEGPERGYLRQFMASVVGSEVCGPEFTPDGTTAFLAIQHPGEGSTFQSPSTHWPNPSGPPLPTVIAVRAKNNKPIGTNGDD